MPVKDHDPFERDVTRALGHPLRLRLLDAIIEAGEATSSELSRRLRHPVSTVSRHVRMLHQLGFLEVARSEQRRGTVAHFYRAAELAFINDAHWEQLPLALRRGLASQTFRKVFDEASAAGGAGGFDIAEAHLDRIPLTLDGQGRRELSAVLHDAMREAEAIQRRSDARGDPDRRDVVPGRLVLLHFVTPRAADPETPGPPGPRPAFR